MDREYKVITGLNKTDVPVPKSYALCEDDDVIGTAFYLMEFKDGRVLWDAAMESSDKEEASGVYESMNDSMAKLHLVNPSEIGLEDFGKPGNSKPLIFKFSNESFIFIKPSEKNVKSKNVSF